MDSVGVAIIAKDEETNLPKLLASLDGCFQRAVLLDTGSTDDTIDVFSAWAREQSGMTFSVAAWEWNDDFAEARNAADRLLLYGSAFPDVDTGQRPLVDWRTWIDCDDVLVGGRNLRRIATDAAPEVVAFFAGYNYAQDEHGNCVVYLERERLVRASYKQPWIGRVHEATPITNGAIAKIPSDVVEWRHRKQENPEKVHGSNDRNLKILKKWNEDEPGDTRIVGYLGVESMVNGEIPDAIKYFHEYNSLDPKWPEEHAQINRKLAMCYLMSGDSTSAKQAGLRGLEIDPHWTDSYLTMAEAFYMEDDYSKTYWWAQQAEALGKPESMLILNPQDYEVLPKKLKALALGGLEEFDDALAVAQEIAPDGYLAAKMNEWHKIAKRNHTANTIVMMAEQLVGHDEQLKAAELLDNCVPHFAMEHPAVCAMRAKVHQRLRWANKPDDYAEHYETGGSKPEDFIKEEQIDQLCEYLPRTNFLLEGLREQQAS